MHLASSDGWDTMVFEIGRSSVTLIVVDRKIKPTCSSMIWSIVVSVLHVAHCYFRFFCKFNFLQIPFSIPFFSEFHSLPFHFLADSTLSFVAFFVPCKFRTSPKSIFHFPFLANSISCQMKQPARTCCEHCLRLSSELSDSDYKFLVFLSF